MITVHCATCGHEWDLPIKIPMDLDRFVTAITGCVAAGCPRCGAHGAQVLCGPAKD